MKENSAAATKVVTKPVKAADSKDIDFSNKEVKEKYLSELAKKYPEGITREVLEETTRTIKRVIVVKSSIAVEYREVKYNYGGIFYFKNGASMTPSAFAIETK